MSNILPAAARIKLANLIQASRDADGLANSDRNIVAGHTRRIADIEKEMVWMRERKDCADELRANEEEVALLSAEVSRIKANTAARERRASDARTLVAAVERWLTVQDGREFFPAKAEAKTLKGETVKEAIARVRGEIAELEVMQRRAAIAPIPASEQKAAAKAYVEDLAKRHKPFIGIPSSEKHVATNLMFDLFQSNYPTLGFEDKLVHANMSAALAWLFPGQLLSRLEEEIDSRANDAEAISSVEKERIAAETPAKIMDLERIEEALVEQALSAGFGVARRANAHPAAILGIEVVKRGSAKAAVA
jgi:hypothetical protein